MSNKSGRPALNFSNKTAAEKPVEVAPATAPAAGTATAKAPKSKGSDASSKTPAFTLNATVLASLLAMSGAELIAQATEKGIDKKWLADSRNFSPTAEYVNGDKTPKADIRGAVMQFALDRHSKGDIVRAAELNAFMFLGEGQLYKGKYDLGYPAAAKENNGSRGMIAKGMLKFVAGTPAPEQPATPASDAPVETPAADPAPEGQTAE